MAPTPDVKVRLSAEGIEDILRAFKTVENASDKSGRKMGQSLSTLNVAGVNLSQMFGRLAAAVSVGVLLNFVRDAGAAADAAGDLAVEVQSSVTNLSALLAAGRQAAAGPEEIQKALTKVAMKIADLREGVPAAAKTFSDLGLSAKDFDGKDTVEAFTLIASKVGPAEKGIDKIRIASDLFGDKLGTKLIPLLNDAAVGIDRLVEHARDTGQLFTDEDVARIQAANDSLDSLKQTAQVAGAQFTSGLEPAIQFVTPRIEKALKFLGPVFRWLGSTVGEVMVGIETVIANMVDAAVTLFNQLKTSVETIGKVLEGLKTGGIKGALDEIRKGDERQLQLRQGLEARVEARRTRAEDFLRNPDASSNAQKPSASGAGTGGASSLTAAQKSRLAAEKTFADNLLALQRARSQAEEDADKRLASFGILGVEEYYERRKARVIAGTEAELEVLRAARKAAAGIEDPNQRAAELDRIAKQEEALRINRENQIENESEAQRQAMADLEQKAIEVQNRIDDARGNSHAKALREIEDLAQAEDRNALQQGRATRSDELRRVLTLQADFTRDMTDGQAAMNDLAARREQIEARIQAGRTSQLSGQAQILNLERSRLPVLEEIARKLQEEAAQSQNPDAIRQADEFARAVERIQIASQTAHNSLSLVLTTFQNAGQNALAEFFNSGIEKAHGFQDALRSILADMRQLVSQMLSQQLLNLVFSSGKAAANPAVKLAGGGLALGPGGPTSDKIHAWLSNFEFVTRAAVVRQPGALPFLQEFNKYGMDALRRHINFSVKPISRAPGELRFRDGGLVSASPSFTSAGRPPRPGRLVIEVPEGMIARVLESPEGQRIHVKNTARNPRAMRNALGG